MPSVYLQYIAHVKPDKNGVVKVVPSHPVEANKVKIVIVKKDAKTEIRVKHFILKACIQGMYFLFYT